MHYGKSTLSRYHKLCQKHFPTGSFSDFASERPYPIELPIPFKARDIRPRLLAEISRLQHIDCSNNDGILCNPNDNHRPTMSSSLNAYKFQNSVQFLVPSNQLSASSLNDVVGYELTTSSLF